MSSAGTLVPHKMQHLLGHAYVSVYTSAYRLPRVDNVRSIESVIENRLMQCLPEAKADLSTILCRKWFEAITGGRESSTLDAHSQPGFIVLTCIGLGSGTTCV